VEKEGRDKRERERRRSKAKREGERDERHERSAGGALALARWPLRAAAAATRRLAFHAAPLSLSLCPCNVGAAGGFVVVPARKGGVPLRCGPQHWM
jgi:hypothetical protein